MSEELKPCPFCNNKAIKKINGPLKALVMFNCYKCGATVSFQGSEHEPQATKHWNRRNNNGTL